MQFVNDGKAIRGLSEAAFVSAAKMLGVPVATIKAVAEVESKGGGFLADGRPKILFERHKFRKFTAGKYDKSHPGISGPAGGYLGGSKEYDRLNEAMALDINAALMSASWGRFQIMGFNHRAAGYATVIEMIEAQKGSEDAHLQAFVGFVLENNLAVHLRNQNWAKFAEGYNGADYRKNNYDGKMKAAYQKFSRAKV